MESGEDNGKDTTASSYECGKRSGATKVVNDSNGTARQRQQQQQQQLKQSPNPWALERIEQMERHRRAQGGAGGAWGLWTCNVAAQSSSAAHAPQPRDSAPRAPVATGLASCPGPKRILISQRCRFCWRKSRKMRPGFHEWGWQ